MKPRKKKRLIVGGLLALWCGGVASSIYFLGRYEFTPGEAPQEISHWPEKLPFAFNPRVQNLIAAVHPHCPCSKASLSELKAALTKNAQAIIHIVYYRPRGASEEWSQTELIKQAADLPGAQFHFDEDGHIAGLLGARTSFDVFLFAPGKEVIFRGGVTKGRGIYGENAGRAALEAALTGKRARQIYPVYGCPLQKNPKNMLKKV